MKFAMKLTSRIVAVLVIATLTSPCLAAQPVSPPAQVAEHSGGCHEHGNSTPKPKQPHDCCLTGHDAAIPQHSRAQRPPVQYAYLVAFVTAHSLAITSLGARDNSTFFSPESPGTNPLRV